MQSRMQCLVVAMLSLVLSGLAGAQDYRWTEIVIPGGVFQAWGINDNGQVALTTTDGASGILETALSRHALRTRTCCRLSVAQSQYNVSRHE
jgi:hypothetical protein